jgi:hypothetical protein
VEGVGADEVDLDALDVALIVEIGRLAEGEYSWQNSDPLAKRPQGIPRDARLEAIR